MTSKRTEENTPKHGRRHAQHKLETSLSDDDRSMASTLLKKKGKVHACPNCGGLDLSDPPGGGNASKTGVYYCIDCGYTGEPKTFIHEKAYEKFFSFRREKYNEGLDEMVEKRHRPAANLKKAPSDRPGIAAWLSFFLPGIGQVYNSQKVKGIALLLIYLPLVYFLYRVFVEFDELLPAIRPVMASALLILVYATGDAYVVALRKSKAMH